jgi:hypothetical protein
LNVATARLADAQDQRHSWRGEAIGASVQTYQAADCDWPGFGITPASTIKSRKATRSLRG